MGISTDQGVRFQGFHGDILLVMDEAPGIRPDIWEAAEGISAAGDVRWLVLGNPTTRGGPYEALFATPGVWSYTIDAFATPNLDGLTLTDLLALPEHELDENVRPYLVTRRWVRDRYYEWGVDSAEWQARVRGQFPDIAEDALIAHSWIAEAAGRIFGGPPLPGWVRCRRGSMSRAQARTRAVLTIRQGPKVLESSTRGMRRTRCACGCHPRSSSPTDAAHGALRRRDRIGYHLGDVARRGLWRPVVLVNVGTPSRFTGRFANLKAELYWGLRERFAEGDIGGQMDELTQSQLASLRYHHTLRGLIEIESKDEARKRGVRSPDRAEALMLAFAPIAERLRPVAYEVSYR
jgi:hypothetical protein